MEKHTQAAHEDITLYCHYFNDEKVCPCEDECIFVHKESEVCMFGQKFERRLSMFRYEGRNGYEEESDVESDSDDTDDDTMEVDVEKIKLVVEKLEESFKKLSVNLKKHFGPLRCDSCDFEAKMKNGLTMHKRAKHTTK